MTYLVMLPMLSCDWLISGRALSGRSMLVVEGKLFIDLTYESESGPCSKNNAFGVN